MRRRDRGTGMGFWIRLRRAATVVLVSAAAATAAAQVTPAGGGGAAASPKLQEVAIAEQAFKRGTAPADWVEAVPVPDTKRTTPLVVRLADTQVRLDASAAVFTHQALQANDASMLGRIGSFSIAFVPEYQHLTLHSIAILRAGQRLDRTGTANIRFLQPSSEIDRSVYTSSVVAAIVLEDVRVGDTVEYAYTLEGPNPVFAGKYFDVFSWDGDAPVELRRLVLSAPRSRPIDWKLGDDAGTGAVAPAVTTIGDRRRLVFEQRGIDAVRPDPAVPNSYTPYRWIQFSEFHSWAEVDEWALGLFAPQADDSAEFRAVVEKLRQATGPEAQLAAALGFTQREIRYFSLSLGQSSHRPAAPDLVLKRRFGDCKDKTLLLASLLSALGIEAHPVLLSTGRQRRYDQLLPSPATFDHAILQARIGSQVYFLDPTWPEQKGRIDRIGQAHEGTEVLVIAPGSRSPTVIPASARELDTSEQHDEVVLPSFDGDGQLTTRGVFTGDRAYVLRAALAATDPKTAEKNLTALYGKTYPGAEMSAPMQVEDDRELNRIVLTLHLRVPGMAQKSGKGWIIPYQPDNLFGILNGRADPHRSLPMQVPMFPYVARYTLDVVLPSDVAAIQDPSTREVVSPYFRCVLHRSLRGNRAQLAVDFESLVPEVAAKQVADYVAEVRKLEEPLGHPVYIGPEDMKSRGLLGIGRKSLRDSLADRQRQLIDKLTANIAAGKLADSDLAHVYCDRGAAYQALGESAKALADVDKAVEMQPLDADLLSCRAEVRFGQGEFNRAIEDASRAVRIGGAGAAPFRQRGQARFYLKQYAAAADDFARAAALDTDASGRLYIDAWTLAAYRRGGLPVPAELAARCAAHPRGEWPQPALAMLAGALSPQDMLAQVNRKSGDELAMTQTEAYYYLGQRALAEGDLKSAREDFEKVRDLGVLPYIEYSASRFELQDLEGH